jgi:hypothetical protein
MTVSPIIFLLLICNFPILPHDIISDSMSMYDRARHVFLSRDCLTHRLELAAAECGCSAESAIRQVPIVPAHCVSTDALSVKSLKQV